MKTTAITLHNKVIQLPNNARVLLDICDNVCDPMAVIARVAEVGQTKGKENITLLDTGLSTKQCIVALRIGLKHSGMLAKDSDDEIDDAIAGLGVSTYYPLAFIYISSLVEGDAHREGNHGPKASRLPRRR